MASSPSVTPNIRPGFVALLRGVNVGKAKRVPMADWRDLLESKVPVR